MNIHIMWVVDHITPQVFHHEHDFYQMIYCVEGNGKVFSSGKWNYINKGDICFVNPMDSHAIEPLGEMRVTEIKFTVDDKNVRKLTERIPGKISRSENPAISSFFTEVSEECFCRKAYSNDSATALLSVLLVRLIREYALKGEELDDSEQVLGLPQWSVTRFLSSDDQRIRHALEYIEQNMDKKITLADIAEYVHLDKSYLGVLFKNVYGISLMKYVSVQRLERAKEQLLTTDNSITYIAMKTGFKSIHYFCHAFRKSENITPQEYRAQYKNKQIGGTKE